MLTTLFIVGRTTLFTPVDINLEQVVDFLNFYACKVPKPTAWNFYAQYCKFRNVIGTIHNKLGNRTYG
jgi:hypothetical protein